MDGWKGGEDMSTRKRIVGLIAAVAFAASVLACGQGETPAPPAKPTPATKAPAPTPAAEQPTTPTQTAP